MATQRKDPRISINQLGKFLTATTPSKRRSIVKAQKTPSDVHVARYSKASKPIAKYLRGGGTDPSPIANAIANLSSVKTGTDWNVSDCQNTADALKHFLSASKQLDFDNLNFFKVTNPNPINCNGVSISVQPDFIVRGTYKKKKCCGVLKLHFIKGDSDALSVSGQQYVAMICHEWIKMNQPKGYDPHLDICMSLDIFRERIVTAPKAAKQRMGNIEAACQEIASWWSLV